PTPNACGGSVAPTTTAPPPSAAAATATVTAPCVPSAASDPARPPPNRPPVERPPAPGPAAGTAVPPPLLGQRGLELPAAGALVDVPPQQPAAQRRPRRSCDLLADVRAGRVARLAGGDERAARPEDQRLDLRRRHRAAGRDVP